MVGLILTLGAFGATWAAGRRSLVAGLCALLTVGYFYGIVRANVPSTSAYFLFDAAVVALFLTQFPHPTSVAERRRTLPVAHWTAILIGWPLLLLLLPLQDPLVRLVGLRAHVFLLPFLLLGARLRSEEVHRLALGVAVLNLVAFGFGVAEFVFGIAPFYPRNAVTELVYRSRDVMGTGDALAAFRIPGTFANSAAFGGTMVISIPFLIGAWIRKPPARWQRVLLTVALGATVLAVFMAASRTHFMALAALVVVATFSGRLGMGATAAWAMLLTTLGWMVALNPRLQRFTSIDATSIVRRISVSVNESFVDIVLNYPLGVGLGGGGTSLPYFLQHLIRNPIGIENQYGTIMLEQGLPGLLLWAAFIAWVVTRRNTRASHPWALGRKLAWVCAGVYFASGLIGIGLLTSIPFTVLFLLGVGWIAARPAPAAAPADAGREALHPDPLPSHV